MSALLFAPTGTLKSRTTAYMAIHKAVFDRLKRRDSLGKRARKFAQHRKHVETGDRNG